MTNELRASFDTATVEGQIKLFNAKNGSSTAMKDVPKETVINCVGVVQYPEITDTYGPEQEVTVTVIYGDDGISYASVSESVSSAGANLIDFLTATKLDAVKVKVVKATSKKGNDFLNLQMIG